MNTIRMALLGAMFALAPLDAAEAKWVQLGVKVVNHAAEKDTIGVGAVEGKFSKLKLSIHQKGIQIFDFKIKFGNGDVRDVTVKKTFRPGESTRAIVFKKPRVIRAVVLKYKTRGRRRRRAKVEVLGFKVAAVAAKKKGPVIKWKILGVKKVGFRVDRDVIKVTVAAGVYTKIRLKVTDSPVKFRDLKVVFGNGDKIDIPVKKHFKPGGMTRVIDLPGKARIIQKVIMWYDTKGFRGRATVTLMGGKVAGSSPGPRPVAGGKWHLMGTRKVAHRAERDEITGLLKGRFRKLKVKVLKRGIKVLRMKITFGNGETKTFRADKVVRAGGELGPYDCPGSARVIKSVVFWYKTRGRPRGPRAVIELHGKK